jgi:hypothetical protein
MEIKYPVTYRSSVLWFIGSLLLLFVFTIKPLIYIIYGLIMSKHLILLLFLVFPLSFTAQVLMIWTYKLEIDENGFRVKGLFLSNPKKYIRWLDISKITANTNFTQILFIFYKNMEPYTPLRVSAVFLSRKSIRDFIEILRVKAPQTEMGLGIEEFKKIFEDEGLDVRS